MIPAIRWSPGIRWSPAIRWSPGIRWSIRSMDFDNRKVYGDTSITDGLVIFASVVVVIIYPDRNPCCHCCRSCFSCCCHFVYSYTTAFVSFWISLGDSWAAAREAPGNPDLWKLSRARNLYRRDPGGLHHRPGWPDKGDLKYHASILPMLLFSRLLLLSIKRYFSGLWPTPLYQRHRCEAL